MFRKPYNTIALGGTFDHFHAGHIHFIQFANKLAEQLIIGVTSEEMNLAKPFSKVIQSPHKRMATVSSYCKKHKIKAQIVELHDEFGPTIEQSDIQALAVTTATQDGAKKINDLRDKLRLRELPVHVCNLKHAADNQPIASRRIRAGEIDRDGRVYQQLFNSNTLPITLTPDATEFLSKRHGAVIASEVKSFPHLTCVVGDSSLEQFIARQWPYHLGVFDKLQKRQPYTSPYLEKVSPDATVANPSGQITEELVAALSKYLSQQPSIDQPTHLLVNGEEDLAAPTLLLLLPLGSVIYYGQPGEGLIEMEVTEKLKEQVYKHLQN